MPASRKPSKSHPGHPDVSSPESRQDQPQSGSPAPRPTRQQHPIGAHVSISGGHDQALDRAAKAGCEVVQVFTKNNMQWSAPPLDESVLARYHEKRQAHGFQAVFAHAGYLINLATADPATLRKSRDALVDELDRSARLGLPFLVLHPGAHLGRGEEAGLQAILDSLHAVFARTGSSTRVALEVTAGAGSLLGGRIEHLAWLIQNCREAERLCVCLDTCHLFAAGYDIRDEARLEDFLAEFRRHLSWEWVHGVHLNDSKGALGSRKDRHELIGEGQLGLECFRAIMQHEAFASLPLCLETPKGKKDTNDPLMLARLRALREGREPEPLPDAVLKENSQAASRKQSRPASKAKPPASGTRTNRTGRKKQSGRR